MRAKEMLVAAAVTAALCAAPQTAAATVCGTTADQWLGTFTGTVQYDNSSATYDLRVVVDRGGPNGLTVLTTGGTDTYEPRDEHTVIDSGTLDWYGVADSGAWHYFNTKAATCSGDTVANFSGRKRVPWAGAGWFYYGDFQLTRVG
ncbi:MAG: hypothetical protein M3422_22645 [Actinomycetota bacterium]|nr:hypothetical protein [Actinomycetota bacterium]